MNDRVAAAVPQLLFARPDSPAGSVAAASLAVPLAGVSRPALLAAPLVAAGWARAVAVAARTQGVVCRVEPVVTADLAGVTVEVLGSERESLRALPEWFRRDAPALDPWLLDRLRAECLARLSSGERRSDVVRRAFFGDRHRYGVVHEERVRRVREAGAQEVAAATAELLAEHPAPAPVSTVLSPGSRTVPVEGPRSHYLLGTPGVPLSSARKSALHLAWALLGGREGILDRLLRKERGLTYSLAAFSRELAEGGYGMCFAGCRPEALDEVAGCVRAALEGLGRDAVPPELLRSAKERLIIQRYRALQSERALAERLTAYRAAGLGPAELDGYPAALAAVSGAEVSAVARDLLAPDTLLEVRTVGAAER
ncbi:M16 family metallopeptidase [Streptomyces sp. NPDC021093]|uniref:M16 family metallopeptidase n=1 Tax=Streptomyces sp. NPDC021093 TaxID=3365112 RepID=UPI00378B3755